MPLNWTRFENEYAIEKGVILFVLLLVFVYLCSNRFFGNPLKEMHHPEAKDAFQKITLGQRIDINSESLEGILAIPFTTPKMAEDILNFRERHGYIKDKADLEKALGRNRAKTTLILPYAELGSP
jgi:DNA uptake protein ComE-like DNA-binding protein